LDTVSKDQWISVLRLSTKFFLKAARQLAIKYLTGMSMEAIERIVCAKEYFVADWLRTGYVALAQRAQKITPEEAEQIGWRSALFACHVREEAITIHGRGSGRAYAGMAGDHEIRNIVDRIFADELREVRLEGEPYEIVTGTRPPIFATSADWEQTEYYSVG
jgi:hypothetical protein